MWQVIEGSTKSLDDVTALLRRLDALKQHPAALARSAFVGGRDVVVARAPSTVDLMGGTVASAGVRSLEWALGEGALVALQRDDERMLRLVAPRRQRPNEADVLELPLSLLERGDTPAPYEALRDYFARRDDRQWAAPLTGLVLALMREHDVRFKEGLRLLIDGPPVPGPDLAASSSTVAATACALFASIYRPLHVRPIAQLVQKAMWAVAGRPASLAEAVGALATATGHVLPVKALSGDPGGAVELPASLTIFALVPRQADAVAPAALARLQTAAVMGYRIAAQIAALPTRELAGGRVHVADARWRGQLGLMTESDLTTVVPQLPDAIDGASFLRDYQGVAQRGWRIEPDTRYRVRAAASLAVREQQRVEALEALIARPTTTADLSTLRQLMRSSSTDIVDLVEPASDVRAVLSELNGPGASTDIVGARLGFYSGGPAVVVLAAASARARLEALWPGAWVLGGSSPGATTFGHVRLRSIRTAAAS
ncbi:MAG: hypothetical protein U0Q12_06995 [Vicinamibacterales bacterium]